MTSTPSSIADGQSFTTQAPGSVISGTYRVDKVLGAGGMSVVYQCTDLLVDRIVAIKVMRVHTDERLRLRFEREGRAVARLNHCAIVKLHELKIIEDVPHIVMDYIAGVPLSEIIAKEGAMPSKRAIALSVQIAEALDHAHKNGVVHRDLKPSNIMVRDGDRIVVVDFGLAKLETDALHASATQTGEILGSPAYMSPEQASGEKVNAKTDQYALGCVLFECLTGGTPFVDSSSVKVLYDHVHNDPPTLKQASLGQSFPERLEAIVKRLLAKSPQDRFADMCAVKQSLSESLQPEAPISAGSIGAGSRQRWPSVAASVALVILLMVSGAFLYNHFVFNSQRSYTSALVAGQNSQVAPIAQKAVMPESEQPERKLDTEVQDTQTRSWIFTKRFSSRIHTVSANPTGDAPPSVRKTLTDDLLADLLQAVSPIEHLDLSYCGKITGRAFSQSKHGEVLHTLNLSYSGITDDGLQKLNVFPNLSRLELAGTNLKDDELEHLKSLHHLQYLNIADNGDLTDRALEILAKLPGLKTIDGRHCALFSKGAIKAFRVESHGTIIDSDSSRQPLRTPND